MAHDLAAAFLQREIGALREIFGLRRDLPGFGEEQANSDRLSRPCHVRDGQWGRGDCPSAHQRLPQNFTTPNPSVWPYSTAYWFGLADPSNNVDPTKGILTPYYENNNRIIRCPVLDPNQVRPVYAGQTGGYGYNRDLGTTYWVAPNWSTPLSLTRRITDVPATSATFLFCDTALIATWTSPPTAQESYAMAAPFPTLAGGPQPTTHFRHGGRLANVAFLDGHVEGRTEVPFPSPPWWPTAADEVRGKLAVGYLADNNVPYQGQ